MIYYNLTFRKIPQEDITGPDDNGSDSFVSDVQGEWSRTYY